MTHIIVFGASGFIGRVVFSDFSHDGNCSVTGYSSRNCNLLSESDVSRALDMAKGDTRVIFTAAITRTVDNSYSAMISNIAMAHNVCREIGKGNVNHVTFLSTIDVYGIHVKRGSKITESFVPNPNDYYATSKLVSELLLRQASDRSGVPLAVFRLPGIYGIDGPGSTVGQMIQRAKATKKIIVYGEGNNLRDFVYVNDVSKIIRKAVAKKLNNLLNIGTGKSVALGRVASIIRDALPFEVELIYDRRSPRADNRIKDIELDCTKLQTIFPDISMTELSLGVKRYVSGTL